MNLLLYNARVLTGSSQAADPRRRFASSTAPRVKEKSSSRSTREDRCRTRTVSSTAAQQHAVCWRSVRAAIRSIGAASWSALAVGGAWAETRRREFGSKLTSDLKQQGKIFSSGIRSRHASSALGSPAPPSVLPSRVPVSYSRSSRVGGEQWYRCKARSGVSTSVLPINTCAYHAVRVWHAPQCRKASALLRGSEYQPHRSYAYMHFSDAPEHRGTWPLVRTPRGIPNTRYPPLQK